MSDDDAPGPREPPETTRREVAEERHGERIVDPYRWLEADGDGDGDDDAVAEWTARQEAYADAVLDTPARAALAERYGSLARTAEYGPIVPDGGRYFQQVKRADEEQPTLYVRETPDGEGRPLVDPERLDGTADRDAAPASRPGSRGESDRDGARAGEAAGTASDGSDAASTAEGDEPAGGDGSANGDEPAGGDGSAEGDGEVTTSVDWFVPAPDGERVAFGLAEGGDEQYDLCVVDVASGAVRVEVPGAGRTHGDGLAWDAAGEGFYYVATGAAGTRTERGADADGTPDRDGDGDGDGGADADGAADRDAGVAGGGAVDGTADRDAGADAEEHRDGDGETDEPGGEGGDGQLSKAVRYHALGTDAGSDPVVADGFARETWPRLESEGDVLVAEYFHGWDRSDVYALRASTPAERGEALSLEPVVTGVDAAFSPTLAEGTLYLVTDHEAPRSRALSCPVERALAGPVEPAALDEAVPEGAGVLREVVVADGTLLAHVHRDAASRLVAVEATGGGGDGAEDGEGAASPRTGADAGTVADVEGARGAGGSAADAGDDALAGGNGDGGDDARGDDARADDEAVSSDARGDAGVVRRDLDVPAFATVAGLEGDESGAYCTVETFDRPARACTVDPGTGAVETVAEPDVGFDVEVVVEREWFESADGTDVPAFVVRRADAERGDAPTVLSGYGGFRVNRTPTFDRFRVPFVEAGGVYVLATLRGGAEYGEEWHEAGRRGEKERVFEDAEAVADGLVDRGYTSHERLGVVGGSNGGLLVAALLTRDPDRFGAALCLVPLADMLRFHRFLLGASWTVEYGDPDDPEAFAYLRAYSPYHNVEPAAYPPTLVTTAAGDTRVHPAHARKLVARLQAAQEGPAPVALRTRESTGHGVGKPTSMLVREHAEQWGFLATHLDVDASRLAGVEDDGA